MADPQIDDETARARIWDAAEAAQTAMLITTDDIGPHARPMSAILRPDDGLIWFLTDEDSGKLDEIASQPNIAVTFSDGSSHVAFRGTATSTDDRATIEKLWSPAADAFYPAGPGDPAVRVIRFEPEDGELWDSPGKVIALFRMAAAVATGTSARSIGKHVKAEL